MVSYFSGSMIHYDSLTGRSDKRQTVTATVAFKYIMKSCVECFANHAFYVIVQLSDEKQIKSEVHLKGLATTYLNNGDQLY